MANYKVTDAQLTAIADKIRQLQPNFMQEQALQIVVDGQQTVVNVTHTVISRNYDAVLFEAHLLPTAGNTYTYTFKYYFTDGSGFGEPFTRTYTAESSTNTIVYFWFDVADMPEGAYSLVVDSMPGNSSPKAYRVNRYAFPDGFLSGLDLIETVDNSTNDASATADKILKGYSAYAKGEKITGTGETYFLEETGDINKANAITMTKNANYTAGNDWGNPIEMPTDRLVAPKSALTDYDFLVGGGTTFNDRVQVKAVTTKTVGGVEYVDTIQLGHKTNWTAPASSKVSITFRNMNWIKAAFGTPT